MQPTENMHKSSLPPRFFEALEQAILLSRDLLSVLGEEQKALVAMDIETLMELCSRKENRLSRLQAIDALLVQTAGGMCPQAGRQARLAELVPLLKREEGDRLNRLRKELSGLREEILRRNQINRLFAADVQTYLNDAISLITSGVAERPMYGLAGLTRKPSLSQPSLISREV